MNAYFEDGGVVLPEPELEPLPEDEPDESPEPDLTRASSLSLSESIELPLVEEAPELDDGDSVIVPELPLLVPYEPGVVAEEPDELSVPVVDEPDVPLPIVPELPDELSVPMVDDPDEPDAPLPIVPELPDELSVPMVDDPDEPDAPLPIVPELPDELSVPMVDDPDEPEAPLPIVPELPDELLSDGVVPYLGVSLFGTVSGGEELLPVIPVPAAVPVPVLLDCASAMEDTDATTTKETDLIVVFNVMTITP